jgi:ABC-2 type transport system permease protein
MRKDIDEFKKQKLLIGSIIAMPIVLGIILPLAIFVPLVYAVPMMETWDVEGFVEIGDLDEDFEEPWINDTIQGFSLNSTVLNNTLLREVELSDVVLISCIIENSTVSNSSIKNSLIEYSILDEVVVHGSKGKELDGKNIMAIDSNLEFSNKKESEFQKFLPMMLDYMVVMFIILPAILPTLIASYSIVGEKNNKSLEPLFATPISDGEILAGKILSAFVPTMLSTVVAFIISVILIDITLEPHLGYYPIPNLTWILSITLLAPTACLMSILACVLISSKVTDVRAAQQVGGFVVMPVIILMLGVLSGLLLLSPLMVLVVAAIYVGIDLVLFSIAKAMFNREDILVKWA